MMDRVEIAVWIIWCVWLYSVSGALTVTMYKPPLVWNPQLGEFVVARDFERNTAASSVSLHPAVGPIGQAGFREPFYQLPQFKYYPYNSYHFDRLPTGAHIGEEELLRNSDYESESEEVPKLTQNTVQSLRDYDYDSELSSSEIRPSYHFVRTPQAWAKNLLSTNMMVVEKKPTRKYLPPMITERSSADKTAKRSILLERFIKLDNGSIDVLRANDHTNTSRQMLVRRMQLNGGGSVHAPENEYGNTKITRQTPKINTIKIRTNTTQKARNIISEKNNNVRETEGPSKVNIKINSNFGVVNYHREGSKNRPEVRPATSEISTQSRHEFYKKNFFKMVQTAHSMYPNKHKEYVKNKEIIRVTKTFPRKNYKIHKNEEWQLEQSNNNIELQTMDPKEKYSEYKRVPKGTAEKTGKNSNDIKHSTVDPNVKDLEYNTVPKDTDNKTRRNMNDIELSALTASTSTSATSATITATSARPGVVLSASLPSLNSYRYNTFQPPPIMSAYAPSAPVGYPAYEHEPIARPMGFAANIARWILQSVPMQIHS